MVATLTAPTYRPRRAAADRLPHQATGVTGADAPRGRPTGAPTTGRRHPAAVYRRRRTVAVGLLAALGLAGWVGVHDLVAGPPPTLGQSRPIAARVVVVRPGDTLWSIALRVEGDRADVRPLVDALSAEVHGQPLQVGERLTLP